MDIFGHRNIEILVKSFPLDDLDAPEGGVVLASGGAPGEVEPPSWKSVVDEVRTQ